MNIKMLRTFLPSKNYTKSKAFYQELGFEIMISFVLGLFYIEVWWFPGDGIEWLEVRKRVWRSKW